MFHHDVLQLKAFDISQPRSCIAPCAGAILVGSEQEIFLENWATGSGANWNVLCGSFNSNFQSSGPAILLQSNSTCASEMLSKTAIDISQVARQEFVMRLPVLMPSVAVSNNLIMFLTRNSTLPTQGENFNPQNSPQVALMLEVSRNNYYVTEIQKDSSLPILPSGYARVCGSTTQNGPELMCAATASWDTAATGGNYIDLVLNMTGNTQSGNIGSYAEQNQYGAGTCGTSPCSSIRNSGDLPWLLVSGVKYYVGVWNARNNPTIGIGGTGGGGDVDIAYATPFVVANAPAIDDSGFFGPIIRALIAIGVFILNELLAFVSFIAPALQAALTFMETLVTNILNLIGNALGFGNVGTDLSTFLNNMVTFFTNGSYGLPAFFGFFGTYFTNFLRWLQIDFQFIGPIFTIANSILIFGVNGIAEAITIITIGLQMLLFGYGTLMVFSFFLYVGDDGIGGLFTYLGTMEAIAFKILNSIVIVTNLGIDFLIMMISLIPKPFIQMTATRVPRLPTIESGASMSFPKLDFGEARNGNMIVYWLWCMGLWFVCWFESQNPALPGSLAMLDPAVASNVRQLGTFIPLMQAATLVSGGVLLIWFCMLPLRLAGIDVTEAPLGASLGRISGPGPSSVSLSAGKKHLFGPAKRAEKEHQAGEVKKEEEAKKAIEKRSKEIEEKKRSEELRKRELARKPSGKDLRGPNLQ